jgi:hypothetical protein
MALSLDAEASATECDRRLDAPDRTRRVAAAEGRLGLPPMLTDLLTPHAGTHRDKEVQAGTALRYLSC